MEQAVLEYAANSIWQVPMLATGAWLLIGLGRPAAQTQHRIWLVTLALAVLLPLHGLGTGASFEQPMIRSGAMRAAPVGIGTQGNSQADLPGQLSADSQTGSHAVARHSWEHAARLMNAPWLPMRTVQLSQRTVVWLAALYLLTIVFRLMQLGYAWRSAQKLIVHARRAALSQSEIEMLQHFCGRFGVLQPQVLVSSEIQSPLTLRTMRPVLLLPETFHPSTHAEMTAIVCHELAHVRRRDYGRNLLCQVGALPIAYHPATYAIERRIRQTREMVCDAMAADTMRSATGYARCLLVLAQRMLHGRVMAEQVQGIGMFDNHGLEERIMRLLEVKTRMSVRARAIRISVGGVLMAAGITTATVFHVTPTVVQASVNIPAVPTTGNHVESLDLAAMQAVAPLPPALPAIPAIPAPRVKLLPIKPLPVKPLPDASLPPKVDQPRKVIHAGEQHGLTPEERAQLEKDLATTRAQIQEETRRLRSPEFKKQMADMQQEIAEATKKFQSAEVQHQMQILQSPEFKQQMKDIQQQIAEATKKFQSTEVQHQMQILQGPEFKQQMADMQQQIAEATKKFQSAEVQRQMQILQSPEFKKQMEDLQQLNHPK